jgi:hypothetical protein
MKNNKATKIAKRRNDKLHKWAFKQKSGKLAVSRFLPKNIKRKQTT